MINEITKAARTLEGRVISDKMMKTIVVVIEQKVLHKRYGKYVMKRTRLFAHDEKEESKEGDVVRIESCRPLSKNKTWRLVKILD